MPGEGDGSETLGGPTLLGCPTLLDAGEKSSLPKPGASPPLVSASRLMNELRFQRGFVSGSALASVDCGVVEAGTGLGVETETGGGCCCRGCGTGAAATAFSSADSSELLSDSELDEELELLWRGDIIAGVGDGGRIDATLGGLKTKNIFSLTPK